MKAVLKFLKAEIVLFVSLLLAVISACFIAPSPAYLEYIDFRTLGLLFCLMAVVAGWKRLGLLHALAEKLLQWGRTSRLFALLTVLLCFFSSMLITNDVALITFVPLTIEALRSADGRKYIIPVVTLETVAANLGSMATPVGNPQNVYLFSAYSMEIGAFFGAILPYSLLSLVLLVICCLAFPSRPLADAAQQPPQTQTCLPPIQPQGEKKRRIFLAALYGACFLLCLLAVFRVFDWWIALVCVFPLVLCFDARTLKEVDYSLLLTFVFLFVFIGNLGEIPAVSDFLADTVAGHEVLAGVLLSQIFSNVPAAVLLSGFTQNAAPLLVGVNLGGLGTLIASMASLISFRFVCKEGNMGRFLLVFTAVNVAFLGCGLALCALLGGF